MSVRRLLREPLVQFLLGGAALFALHGWVTGGGEPAPDRIVVSRDRVGSLARNFERTWMREPTAAELRGLVGDYITEEILYREALALGLDRDDLIVRRRMRQKMEFLSDAVADEEPDDAALRAHLAAHPERFRIPARLDFEQVFLQAGPEAEDRARDLLARLDGEAADAPADPIPEAADAPADPPGDATLLPREMRAASPARVAATFGPEFAEALATAPEGEWSGPVASGFGLHLVRVEERQPERTPSLEAVRDAVEREWRADRRKRARDEWIEAARARYDIEVRMPDDTEVRMPDDTEVRMPDGAPDSRSARDGPG